MWLLIISLFFLSSFLITDFSTFLFSSSLFHSLWCWPSFHTEIIKVSLYLSVGKNLAAAAKIHCIAMSARFSLSKFRQFVQPVDPGEDRRATKIRPKKSIKPLNAMWKEGSRTFFALVQRIPVGITLKRWVHLFLSPLVSFDFGTSCIWAWCLCKKPCIYCFHWFYLFFLPDWA